MIDLIALAAAVLIILIVHFRRTSAGVAIIALLAGVLLDQLLADWLINVLPSGSIQPQSLSAAVHLLLTFLPMVVALVTVKTTRQNKALSIVASILLGILVLFFGAKVLDQMQLSLVGLKTSGLLDALHPYENIMLAVSAVVAIAEMITSHNTGKKSHKKKRD